MLFGLSFFLAPVPLLSIYGIQLETAGAWIARYLGSVDLGVGLMLWLVRKAPAGQTLSAILLGYFVLAAIGLLVAFLHALSGLANVLAWSTVIIYLLLAVGSGYFQFVKRAGA